MYKLPEVAMHSLPEAQMKHILPEVACLRHIHPRTLNFSKVSSYAGLEAVDVLLILNKMKQHAFGGGSSLKQG
jgi:hypothetical protein